MAAATKIIVSKEQAANWKTWISALESGKYQQGTHCLMTVFPGGEPRYCCIGVLCDVVGGGSWAPDRTYWIDGCRVGQGMLAPGPAHALLGPVNWMRLGPLLAKMNDSDGAGFDLIATYLRGYFEGHCEVVA